MNVLDLFSGIGGFSLGLERAGMRTVAFCEIDPFCRKILAKNFPGRPIYDDVQTLTAEQLRADGVAVDLICGGFPCTDISVAGKGAGITGKQSGLWSEYARIIGEVRPRYVIVENVAAFVIRGLSRVLGDLSELGYDAEWQIISAADVGAPHLRKRIWIIAYPGSAELRHEPWRRDGPRGTDPTVAQHNGIERDAANSELQRLPQRSRIFTWRQIANAPTAAHDWRLTQSPVCGRDDGISHRVDRIKSLGNAVVPQIVEIIGRAIIAHHLDGYDPQDDMTKSLAEGYRVIRERKAAGGKGWEPK